MRYYAYLIMMCIFSAASAHAQPATPAPITGTVTKVFDGDTFVLRQAGNAVATIRLRGIDAPEKNQTCTVAATTEPCGMQSAQFLMSRVLSREVTCIPTGQSSYNRAVAFCSRGKTDLNRMMVRNGHAVAYRAFTKRYVPDEQTAKAAKLGIWRGSMETPACYRHGTSAGCPCPIESCVYEGK